MEGREEGRKGGKGHNSYGRVGTGRRRTHRGSKDPLYYSGPKLIYPHQGEDLCLKHWWELIFFDFKHFKKPRMAVHWEWCSILEKLQNLTNFGIFAKTFFLSDGNIKTGLHRCRGIPNDAGFQIWAQSVNFKVLFRHPEIRGKMADFGSKKSIDSREF